MTDLRKAAEMALAKLEHLWEIGIDAEYKVELLPEIRVLRQAIEQAEYEKMTVKFGERAKEYLEDAKKSWEQEPVCEKDPQGCWSIRCQLGKVCKNTAPPSKPEPVVEPANSATNFVESKHLAQPEQEPVAWIGNADFVKGQFVEGRVRRVWWECNTGVGQPLYTAPPKREWVGLTVEEIKEILYGLLEDDRTPMLTLIDVVQEKLKEKNGG